MRNLIGKWDSIVKRTGIGLVEFVSLCVASLLLTIAPMYNGSLGSRSLSFFVLGFLTVFLFLVLSYLVFRLLCRRLKMGDGTSQPSLSAIDRKEYLRGLLLPSLVLFAFWVPYGICLYPGVVFFDTSFQLGQFFGNPNPEIFPMLDGASYTDHHPIFDTILFGLFVKLGASFFSANVGMFLYLLLQAILTALSFSYALLYMKNSMGIKKSVYLLLLFFFAACPIVPISIFSMTKDSLYSWLYILFFILIVDIVRTRGINLAGNGKFLAIVLISVLLGLTKKTGVYVVLLTFVGLCIVFKPYWKKLICVCFAPLLVTSVIIPLLVFPLLNVSPGSKVEMLGFFYQQTARYVIDYPDDVMPNEQDAISEVLDYENLPDRYSPGITNTIKNVGTGANLWPSTSQVVEYMKCYVAEGLRHPDAYFNAVASLEAGWFDWTDTIVLPTASGMQCVPANGEPEIYRPDSFQVIANELSSLLLAIEKAVPFSLLFKAPLYAVLIPLYATLYILRKDATLLPAMLPVWVSFLLLMISPVSAAVNAEAQRYLLPFVFTAPLLFSICVSRSRI